MARPHDIAFACNCGKLAGTLRGASPGAGTHSECFCRDCRAAELHLGQPDPAPGPVGIFQTTPDRLTITKGADRLAVFSFGAKNVLRWQAACCGTPLFNTPRSARFSFVGIRTNILGETAPLGPVVGQAFLPTDSGKTRHKGLPRFIWGTLSRSALQLITGRWKKTPFFKADGVTLVSPVEVLPQGTRKALLDAAS
jgi:hypothetical protein